MALTARLYAGGDSQEFLTYQADGSVTDYRADNG